MNSKKVGLLLVIVLAIAAFFYFDLGQYFTLDAVKAKQQELQQQFAARPLFVIAIYFLVYVVMAALALPGAALLTLLAGAIFGFWLGLVVVSFASSIGATVSFLVSRFVAGSYVQSKFADKLSAINKGIEKDGPFYLFTLRLIPILPFFAVNLLMGLTQLKTKTFYWVSQLGMLLGTAVYVNVGTQLAGLTSLKGILSAPLIGSFVLLGIFAADCKENRRLSECT